MMDYDQRDVQCDNCHQLWNIAWMDGTTCIECSEIEEHGISMSEELEWDKLMENYDEDDEIFSPCNPCGHVDNCIVCYPDSDSYSGSEVYSYWWETVEMESYFNCFNENN